MSTSSGTNTSEPGAEELAEGDAFRLLPIVNTLLRRRWTVCAITTACAAGAVAYSLLAEPTWTATMKFIPSSAASMSARMGSIVGGTPGADADDETASADYYVALLQSPSFLRSIVTAPLDADGSPAPLVARYGIEDADPALGERRAADRLAKSLSVSASRAAVGGGPRIVTVAVTAESPGLASQIADVLISRINEHNSSVRGGKSRQNRTFIEEQLGKARTALEKATDDFSKFSSRNRRLATPALEAERDRLEREVRVQEEVFVTLTKQLELAKIEEQESRPSIEVIQQPDPPLVRTSPRRTQTVLLATALGSFAACIWVLVSERMRSLSQEDPEAAEFRRQLDGIRREALAVVGRSPKHGDDRR